MMQPPRQIFEIAPRSMFQSYSAAPARISSNPCEYATIFDAYSARRTSSMNASASSTVSASTGPGQLARDGALLGVVRERAGEDGFGDAGDGHAEVQRGLHRPRAGALRAGLVEDDVDERLAGLGIHLAEHLGGDLDQVRLQLARVPLGEHVRDLGGASCRCRGGSGRTPRRSAACRRTRCRCAPSSRSDRRRRGRRA